MWKPVLHLRELLASSSQTKSNVRRASGITLEVERDWMPDDKFFELGFLVVGGLWAASSAVYQAAQIANERRDRIIIGYFEGCRLTPSHRRLMLRADWLPMSLASAFLCISYGFVLFFLPNIAGHFSLVISAACRIVSAVPIIGGIAYFITIFEEYKLMKTSISNDEQKEANCAGSVA